MSRSLRPLSVRSLGYSQPNQQLSVIQAILKQRRNSLVQQPQKSLNTVIQHCGLQRKRHVSFIQQHCRRTLRYRSRTQFLLKLEDFENDDDDDDDDDNMDNGTSLDTLLNKEAGDIYRAMMSHNPHSVPYTLSPLKITMADKASVTRDRFRLFQDFARMDYKLAAARLAKAQALAAKREIERLHEKTFEQLPQIMLSPSPISVKMVQANNLALATQFGRKCVFDCSEQEMLTSKEKLAFVTHLSAVLAYNETLRDPYAVWLCSLLEDSELHRLISLHPQLSNQLTIFQRTEKSYIDIFPRDRIVMLAPAANRPFKPAKQPTDPIYVMSVIANEAGQFNQVALAKARQEGVLCCSLTAGLDLKVKRKNYPPTILFKALVDIVAGMTPNKAFATHLPQGLIHTKESTAVQRKVSLQNANDYKAKLIMKARNVKAVVQKSKSTEVKKFDDSHKRG